MTKKELVENKVNNKKILKEYSGKFSKYNDFAASIHRLIILFLKAENIQFHSVIYRAKDVYSLKHKIKRKFIEGKVYNSLSEIADLAGIRVILFFKNDVEKVKKILQKEFFVFKEENVDKKNLELESGNLNGYTSVHRVVSISKKRLVLKEYAAFENMRCEIQIRTILQNAWAEIEHGIGYKPVFVNKKIISNNIQKLFQISAKQLESVDENFNKINQDYETLIKKYVKKISKNSLNIPINRFTLEAYLSERYHFEDIPEPKSKLLIEKLLQLCDIHAFKTIKDLHKSDIIYV